MKSRLFLIAIAASAHPMGNFSVSHYTRLEVSTKGVQVTYVLDLAEAPAYRLLRDWNLDAKSSQSLLDQKVAQQAREWAHGLEFRSAGKAIEPQFLNASIKLDSGADGQPIARVVSNFELPGVAGPLQFEDHNYPDRAGWKEIVIAQGGGIRIVRASQDSQDRSKMLTDYPSSAVSSAPQDLRASVEWRAGDSSQAAAQIVPIEQPPPVAAPSDSSSATAPAATAKNDFLSRLLAQREIPWPWLLLGLVIAFGMGGAHALEPGHGKTLVAAYLVGSRGTMKHAALLGAMVTFTHTISVFLLGLAMLLLAKSIVPDKVIKILEAVSGLSIVAIGAVLFVQRLRSLRAVVPHHHHAHDHAHPHDHHHDHDHPHSHPHDHSDEHGPHTHTHMPQGEITPGSLIALGVSGGLVPCPAALVIMLAAIAFGHTGAGLILLVAFSLGLAGVLIAVGWLVLYARSWLPDPAAGRSRLFRLLPVVSALVIVCIGLVMTGVSLGWLRPGLAV